MGIIVDFAKDAIRGHERHPKWLLDTAIKFEQSEAFKQFELNAHRYEFLRDKDNWGEDDGEDSWENLAESHSVAFDEIVDNRITKHNEYLKTCN